MEKLLKIVGTGIITVIMGVFVFFVFIDGKLILNDNVTAIGYMEDGSVQHLVIKQGKMMELSTEAPDGSCISIERFSIEHREPANKIFFGIYSFGFTPFSWRIYPNAQKVFEADLKLISRTGEALSDQDVGESSRSKIVKYEDYINVGSSASYTIKR